MRSQGLWAVMGLGVALACGPAGAAPGSRMIPVDAATQIHVLDSGPDRPGAATLVLIPGWRFTASIWSGQLAAFASDRRVVAIDPRSQGESSKTAQGDTPEQRARDLRTVLGRLRVGRRVLVGWSQGVQDVAAYIQQFGTADIDGVVPVDSTISGGAPAIAAAPGTAAQQLGLLPMLSQSPRDYTVGMMRAVITRPLAPAELKGLVDQALKTPTAIGEAVLVADMFGVDRRPAIARLNKPVLVIASPRSPELAEQKAMAARLADARFEVVAERFNALLRDFLARLKV